MAAKEVGVCEGGNNAEFSCVEPFNIDDGQLDHLRRNECFVLGYELASVSERMEHGIAVDVPVHSDNADRIRLAAKRRGVGERVGAKSSDDVLQGEFALIVNHDDWFQFVFVPKAGGIDWDSVGADE